MQGLMLKLLNVDAAGERALRVVAYFDQLSANEPDLEAVVRAAAVIADCPAGAELPTTGVLVRYSPDGEALVGLPVTTSEERSLIPDNEGSGRVWLEREGAARELDEFIVERFSITALSLLNRFRAPSEADYAIGFSDPALAQLFINPRASEAERSRAARLIGIPSASRVQLIALELVPEEPLEQISSRLRTDWARTVYVSALSRQLGLAIVAGGEPISWNGIGLAGRATSGSVVDTLEAPTSWHEARETLRFAGIGSPWHRQLDAADLGSVRLLARVDRKEALADQDVQEVSRLAEGANGAESLLILDHFLHADSMRSAARATNFHHSSLQTRLARIGLALGLDLRTPSGRQRAATALLLWRLTQTG